jgi:hypothetical protein
MINKKLIALFVAVATVSAISAYCYRDADGIKRCDRGVVRNTGYVAGDAVEGSADVVAGTVGGLFGGRGVRERREDRREAQRNREKARRMQYEDSE